MIKEHLENKYMDRVRERHQAYDGFGEAHTAAEWSRLLCLPRTTLWRYLSKGLTIEQIAELRHITYTPENAPKE